jgi:hypothetical protein
VQIPDPASEPRGVAEEFTAAAKMKKNGNGKAAIAATIKNRIVGRGYESPKTLNPNPHNWRKHSKSQSDALEGLIDEVGWVQSVIKNKRTGNLVDGHLRVQMALKRGETKVPVTYVDLSPKEEKLALAMLDPIGAMATTDDKALARLASDLDADNINAQEMLARLLGTDDGGTEKAAVAFTEELLEEHNFVVLYFDNSVDWLNFLSILDLPTVKALHARDGFMSAGVGRVIRGVDALASIKESIAPAKRKARR